ncbi:MAG: hypothetical protein L0287_31360, partial [Anaerolineae bacterium]|nr:hypothetical protein [Anaerolineae bacterium]
KFKGATPGLPLLRFLQASKTKESELEETTEQELIVKSGNAKLRLALEPVDSFLFEMPPEPKDGFTLTDEFIKALECCLMSASDDPTRPDRLGVTFVPNGNAEFDLFSTNGVTITNTFAGVKHGMKKGDRVTLVNDCCHYLVTMHKQEKPVRLSIMPDCCVAIGSRGTMLFGRLVETENPLDYVAVTRQHLSDQQANDMIEIPEKMPGAIKRSLVILEEEAHVNVDIKDGLATFHSLAQSGAEIKDRMKFPNHPNVRVKVLPKLLKEAVDNFSHVLFTDKCVAFQNKQSFTHLIAAHM